MIPQTVHRLFKRYQADIEGAVIAVGLGALVGAVLVNFPVYPTNWSPVLIAVVILLGFRFPLPAYLAAVAIVAYPLYSVSLYLAVLFVAVGVLLQRPLSHYLGATVLVLATPLLAKYNLHWLVPIIAGLWWGATNGLWIAGLAALWGKILGGMAGLSADWLLLAGKMPAVAGVSQRFHALSAIDTLNKLLQPFAPNSTVLLYHLMQIALWAAVGALVGVLADRNWLHRRFYPWATIITAAIGAVGLVAGHLFMTLWLQDAAPEVFPWQTVLTAAAYAAVITGGADVIRRFLDLPLAPATRKRFTLPVFRRFRWTESRTEKAFRHNSAPVPVPNLPDWEPPTENNDLILLELD